MVRGGGSPSSSSEDEDVADDAGRFTTVALLTFCAFFRAGFSSVTLLLLFGDSVGVAPRLPEPLIQLGNGLEA